MSVNQTVENVYLRQGAVQLTRKHFWHLLGMMLVITLVTCALDMGMTALGDLITRPETDAAVTAISSYAASETITSSAPMTEAVSKVFASPKFWLFNLVYIILNSLVSSGLALGRHAQLIAAGRGEKPRVLGGFSRMRHCFKAWRLELWVGLKVLLWLLPGFLVLLLGIEMQVYDHEALATPLILAGIGLMIGLVIPALLRYSLSTFILADEPDRGVRDCVNFSKGLMEGRKWQYFKLGVPMFLKCFGVCYVAMMVFSLIGAAIGTEPIDTVATIVILLMLLILGLLVFYFSMQFDLVCALFYLKRRKLHSSVYESSWVDTLAKADPAEAAPISAWLEEHTATDIESAEEEAAESTDAPEESEEDSPEDTSPETNEEKTNY